jgi:hypothetical protein
MDVCFELFDRYYEELGAWPIALGAPARALLYAFRDHSPEQHGGRLLLPDLALASPEARFGLRRVVPPLTAFCGMIGALRTRHVEGRERRDETSIRLECGIPLTLILQTRRWDNVDVAPVAPPPGLAAWQAARPARVADVLSGLCELQEAAFEVGGVSSFPLLEEGAPDYPVQGTIARLERLNLEPSAASFGALETIEQLPHGLFWPHRYFVTLSV